MQEYRKAVCSKHGVCEHEVLVVCEKCTAEKRGTQPTANNTQSTAFLTREEFRDIAVKYGVGYGVAIGLYWDVKNAAHL